MGLKCRSMEPQENRAVVGDCFYSMKLGSFFKNLPKVVPQISGNDVCKARRAI